MLFVELALIRWLGANIVYLSYYSNFVLLGSFLGIGLGFLRARSSLLGAMAGGVMEYVSLITGYRALLILVAGLYSLALLTGRRALTARRADVPGLAEVREPARAASST
ncbi:MAG: hypothetical protein LBV34_18245 [Nocardiopsaceae bacterium]|jgi:hypothetical protein|nr:hypothetical protein [Nocardiopsaceae bacterium]